MRVALKKCVRLICGMSAKKVGLTDYTDPCVFGLLCLSREEGGFNSSPRAVFSAVPTAKMAIFPRENESEASQDQITSCLFFTGLQSLKPFAHFALSPDDI